MAKRKSIKERDAELKPLGKQLKLYGLVLRIYPNSEQMELISRTFCCVRLMYNLYLNERQMYYKGTGKTLSVSSFKTNIMNPAKTLEENSFLKDVDKFALEVACEHVEEAYDRFFKKQNGYPKFKSKRKSKKSYTTRFTNNNIRVLNNKYIQLPKLGKVEIAKLKSKKQSSKLEKLLNGECRITNATVSQKGGRYYVSLCLEEIIDLIRPIKRSEIDLNKVCGIDLGLKTFATIYNGVNTDYREKENFIKLSEMKLAKLQKKLSKKKIHSNNFIKCSKKVAKLQEHIANQRKDFNHKLSTEIANENQVVVLEDLNIKGMVKNKRLAKSINDAGWYQFITFLKYKLEWQGKIFIQVDKWFASSKICSKCGDKKISLSLNEREWVCSSCGTLHERDSNAAQNIREEGLKLLNMLA